jgi:hypothetical protein
MQRLTLGISMQAFVAQTPFSALHSDPMPPGFPHSLNAQPLEGLSMAAQNAHTALKQSSLLMKCTTSW